MTSLVDLAVRLDRLFFSPVETQHLSYLQDMPLLGLLHLTIQERFPPRSNPPSERKDIFLPELNFLCFTGHITQLNVLMAYLADAFASTSLTRHMHHHLYSLPPIFPSFSGKEVHHSHALK